MRSIHGRAVKIGDYVSADVILPSRFSFCTQEDMAANCLADLGQGVNEELARSSILVAGEGLGYGTGRESPARALKAAGIVALIAGSFGRIFYRNVINQGIVALEAPEVPGAVSTGDMVTVDPAAGTVACGDREFAVERLPPFILDIMASGGLVGYARSLLRQPVTGGAS